MESRFQWVLFAEAGRCMRIRKTLREHGRRPPRILIVRLSAIGDVVRALPILHCLREGYPDARIDWVVERKSAAVVEGHPYLHELFVFERPPGIWRALREFFALCRRVRANQYDIVVDAHGILKSGVIAWASGAPTRVGFARPRSREGSYLLTNVKVRLPSDRLNRIDENLALCRALVPDAHNPTVVMYVPWDVQNRVDRFFDDTFDGGKAVVIVHPPVERASKQWPLDHYARLCDLLLADGRFDVLLTWGPGQFQVAEEVRSKTRRKPVVAPEMPDLKHYAWLVHRANLYMGGDTGPMHIASAMGTPVVAVFGGTDPIRHAPFRRPFEILYTQDSEMDVQERLRRITPEAAYDACVRVISQSQPTTGGAA